jgi:hypothetical protein
MIFWCCFMGSNIEACFIRKKIVDGPRVSVSSRNRKITSARPHVRPNSKQRRCVPMKFQWLHRAVNGTAVVPLYIVMCAVHIRLLARQIHNARILPTAAATRPARLRHSLPAAALLFSSPTAPSVTTVMWTRLLRADVCSANLKTVDADPLTSSPATTTSRPPQSMSRRGSAPSNHHENNYFICDRG